MQREPLPATIIVSGRVTAVERLLNTFAITVWQIVVRGSALSHLCLRAVMGLNAEWRQPNHRFPAIGSIVMITGDVLAVEESVVSVAVNDIALLSAPPLVTSNVLLDVEGRI